VSGCYTYVVHARTARGRPIPGVAPLAVYGRDESQALDDAKAIAREHPKAIVSVQVEWSER
jgi:hypothetical protein